MKTLLIDADKRKGYIYGFIDAYNKRKETHPYSLEQARLIWNYAGNFFDEPGERMSFDDFIKSLSPQPGEHWLCEQVDEETVRPVKRVK